MFNKELYVDTRKIIKSDTMRLDAIYINILPKEPIIIKNIYYDFDDWKLTEKAKTVIDTTLFLNELVGGKNYFTTHFRLFLNYCCTDCGTLWSGSVTNSNYFLSFISRFIF